MTKRCLQCRRPMLDLAEPDVARTAQKVYDTLSDLGGVVRLQDELLQALAAHHGMGRGTGQRYIDGLVALGMLDAVYRNVPGRRKAIFAVRRPTATRRSEGAGMARAARGAV